MKRLLILMYVCTAGTALGQLQVVVVPNGLANVEGNSSSAELFRTSSTDFQQVYAAYEFGFAPTSRIDGMSFRFDGASGQSFLGFWPISVILSTTTQSPDSLSPRLSDNAGPDAVLVFGGFLGISATNSPDVRPFELAVPFQTPFIYEPAKGNLSVYLGTGPGPTSLLLDAQFAAGDSVGRVFGYGTIGTVDTLGLVTRFDLTPIPEPSSLILGVLGASVLVLRLLHLRRRMQSSN